MVSAYGAAAASSSEEVDGGNLNAIVAKFRPGDLGVDATHLNLHTTLSMPHGSGGSESGPVVLSDALALIAPLHSSSFTTASPLSHA